jgi:rhamnose transport system permease protein
LRWSACARRCSCQALQLANLLTDSTLLIMLALTQMLVIVTRGVDLSVASNLALSGMIAALLASLIPACR